MLKNNEIYGFKIIETKFIEEIDSDVKVMEHIKSGAQLIHIPTDDTNKTFSVSFRTPPKDDTGLPHILEHSVLCGSRKFPCKEPFVELVKGSLNTYLNAMTYPDKTMYPVSSQNDKDFINLMDVYLDAVFFPNIYDNPHLLAQEGWSYKVEEDGSIEYQGVVYNEMKGALASPESFLAGKVKESLFPDNIYKYESGGNPKHITDLNQEQFTNYHKNYYHPSNSYICLYGDGDIDTHLKLIDEEYLSHFKKIKVDSKISTQKSFDKMKNIELKYPISEGEDTDNKTYLALNFVVGESKDRKTMMAMELLEHLLLDTPAAPLRKALIDAEIGQDIFGNFSTSLKQPVFSIIAKNSSPDKKEDFQQIIKETLEKIIKDGFNKDSVQGAINTMEFHLREADSGGYSKGLFYSMDIMKTWLHDGSPFDYLEYEGILADLKTEVKNGYLEKTIQKLFIDNNHSTMIVMNPSPGLIEREDLKTKEKLEEIKNSWTPEEIKEMIDKTKELEKIQKTPDTKEDLDKIPTLKLTDIDENIDFPKYSVDTSGDIPVILTPSNTNEIAYLSIYYDLEGIDAQLLPYINILSNLLGKIDTKNYSYEELNKQIEIYTGGLSFGTQIINKENTIDEYSTKFVIRSKVLYNNIPKLNSILSETISNTVFDNPKRIRDIIREVKSQIEISISQNGHKLAINRLMSYFTNRGMYNEKLKGFEFYKFICELDNNFNKLEDEIISNLERAYKILNNKNRVTLGITANDENLDSIKKLMLEIFKDTPTSKYETKQLKFELNTKNEALLAPFNIQYVAKAYNFKELGYEFNGSMAVLKNILALDYLWDNVRVQNGAYGCFAELGRNGTMFFASYRDPQVKTTIDTYNNAYKYIRDFNPTSIDMRKYIIGTISNLDFPVSPSAKGARADRFYFAGINKEALQKERNEIINTTKEDIQSLSKLVKECMDKDYICVVGNKSKIEESKNEFDQFIDVFQ